MEKIKIITTSLLIVCIAICLTSCQTTTRITVSGQPGEKVYIRGTNEGYTLTDVGKKIKMADYYEYLAFALSEKPGDSSDVLIPFALDYKKRSVALLWITGIVGLYPTLGIWPCVAWKRAQQPAYWNRYKYLSRQKTNSDMTFTHPNITYLDPPGSRSAQHKQDEPLAKADESTSEKSVRHIGEKANRTLSDLAKSVSGTYNGKGTLTLNGEVIESYSSIKVIIKKIDNKTVSVDVIEGGTSFFAKPGEYSVSQMPKGGYKLTNKAIPSAEITIDTKKNIRYTHPRINIDGTIYQLQIK